MEQQKSPGKDRAQLNQSLLAINAFIFDKKALLLLQQILSLQFFPQWSMTVWVQWPLGM